VNRAWRTNPLLHSTGPRRQVTASVDLQLHDEFEIICKDKGVSKSAYLREIITGIVNRHLSQSALRIPPKENSNAAVNRRD
jgi:hypothetical protein